MKPANLWPVHNDPPMVAPDEERELVAHLCKTVTASEAGSDPMDVINLYTALKTKPLMILAGPGGSGKIALVERLANALKGGPDSGNEADHHRLQMMLGHPWWASTGGNTPLFTDAHKRFNSEKLLLTLSEACRPENMERLYIACLTRISPAELVDFFCDLAMQMGQASLSRLGSLHLESPLTFPPNLRLVGTMDILEYHWWDDVLLSQTMVIPRIETGRPVGAANVHSTASGERIFLRSSIRSRFKIYQKIHTILSPHRQPLLPLVQIENLLVRYRISYPQSITENALAYLANSWTNEGNGLFARSANQNLEIALDFAISQVVLPRIFKAVSQVADVHEALTEICKSRLPRSARLLRSITVSSAGEPAAGIG